jgi:hypothetical protein
MRLLEALPAWDWVDDDTLARERIHSQALRRVADTREPGGNLFLFGPTGIGKTAAIARMVRRWIRYAEAEARLPDLEASLLIVSDSELESATNLPRIALAYSAPLLIVDGPIDGPPRRPFGTIVGDVLRQRLARISLGTIVASTVPREALFDGMGLRDVNAEVVEDWAYDWRANRSDV